MSDIRAAQARRHHHAASASDAEAAQHRALRNDMVRRLRNENPHIWTYRALARAVGCTEQLIAAIIKNRVP